MLLQVSGYGCVMLCTIMYICGVHRNTLLKGIHNFIHLNLAIALILALTVFAFGIELGTNSDVSLYLYMYIMNYNMLPYIGSLSNSSCSVTLPLHCCILLDVV